MTEARRTYYVSSLDLQGLNLVLNLIADRFDQLEGRRGAPIFKNDIDMDQNRIVNSGDAVADMDIPTKRQVVIKSVDAGNTVKGETAFGLSPSAGTSVLYSRKDHTHGSPDDPVPAHEAAADPHVTYQKESEKGIANGYASLAADVKVAVTQLRNPIWIGITAPDPTEYPLWLDIS